MSLQKRKGQESDQEQSGLESLKEKFSKEKAKVIDTEISQEDRQVRLTVTMDQFCGCGGKEDVEVTRTVPWDSPLNDGDKVEGFHDSDEIH